MAFDDEKIRIQVDGSQAAAQLGALAGEVQALEKELEDLNNTAGVTNAEIEGTTRRLGEARAKFAEQAEAVREAKKAQDDTGESTKSLADKYLSLGVKVFGARQVLMAAGEAMRSVAQATGNYSGATKDAIDQTDNLLKSVASLDLVGASAALGQLAGNAKAWAEGLYEVNVQLGNMVDKKAVKGFTDILAAQRDLVEGHKQEIAQLDLKAKALAREIELQQQNGEVSVFLKEKLQEYLDGYVKLHEAVPRFLQEQAFELNVVSSETEKLGNKAVEAHTKAATAGKAHSDSLEKIAADQEKVIANAERMIAEIDAAAVRANQAEQQNPGGDAVVRGAEDLKKKIKEIEDSPIITADQQRNLDELKNALLDNKRAADEMNRAFTATADNFLTDAEAAAKYGAELAIAGEQQRKLSQWNDEAQATEEELSAARWDNLEALNMMEDAAGDLGGEYQDLGKSAKDVAEAAKSIGDETKKGADKGKEGLGNLKEGLEEALPIAKELRDVMQEIVVLGAQADI